MWQKIYMSEFGTRTWRPKSVDNAAPKDDPVEVEDRSAGNWKKLYFRTTAGHEMTKWRRELREYSPYTGLPRQTEWVLRYERQPSSGFSGAVLPVWYTTMTLQYEIYWRFMVTNARLFITCMINQIYYSPFHLVVVVTMIKCQVNISYIWKSWNHWQTWISVPSGYFSTVLFFLFFQKHECELGADGDWLFGTGDHTGAEPSVLLRVLCDHLLEWRQLPQILSHPQHPAARSPEGAAEEPWSQEVRHFSSTMPRPSTRTPSPLLPHPLHQACLAFFDIKAGGKVSVCPAPRQRQAGQTAASGAWLHHRYLEGKCWTEKTNYSRFL